MRRRNLKSKAKLKKNKNEKSERSQTASIGFNNLKIVKKLLKILSPRELKIPPRKKED
jgi:hypothetical protein